MTPILSNNYYVHFNEAAYAKLNEYILNTNPSSLFILVDENTNENCLPILLQNLETTSPIEIIEIEAGEEHKNLETCTGVWNALTELGGDRKCLLINLGGGVITDLGGFVASTFKRGIAFINIPTTLLSMVDASVGGKTGVDLGVLKNQIGLFSNPEMVLIDPTYLETVTERELRSGLAEIIKYGLTYDISIWNTVNSFKNLTLSNLNTLIHRSIEIKNEVVTKDPKEAGIRKVLNFGHTLGHAIESYYLETESKDILTHGEAIAVGMVTEAYISHKLYHFPLEEVKNIKSVILKIYGKIDIEPSDYQAVIELLIHDKKNIAGKVNFVLLTNFEHFKLDCEVEIALLKEALDYYSA
ncbi:MAG: 3-dehydroquinate synthase [Lutibacter sp.]|uniref:3-dehydroquinate synthase n=1 Tax=Lutibacter sp. TaxID=1925666 RepID=UPI00181EAD5A|nr:3-dehydroquinate synthase [Lutibacter sp.]MBT8317482.1 3-dehydroquinate synthase [Lutibacter sp.]NNJ58341.1 3-dehydroquinate synthase [Lutibacter sp.]